MSHWKTGKLELKCSLSVLKRALINVMPRWEEYIQADEGSQLSIHNSYTNQTQKGFALVVPGGDNPMGGTVPGIKPAQPRISYADMGFKKNPDGTWAVEVDTMGLPREIRDIEASLQDEVARMKVRALAASRGYQIVNEERAGDQTYIDMIVPVEEQYRLQG